MNALNVLNFEILGLGRNSVIRSSKTASAGQKSKNPKF